MESQVSTSGSSPEFNSDVRVTWSPERLAKCSPEKFNIRVMMDESLAGMLTEDEADRMNNKIPIVIKAAQRMCAAMLKGTLKYQHDSWDVDKWLDYLQDDATDTINYIGLLREARRLELIDRSISVCVVKKG